MKQLRARRGVPDHEDSEVGHVLQYWLSLYVHSVGKYDNPTQARYGRALEDTRSVLDFLQTELFAYIFGKSATYLYTSEMSQDLYGHMISFKTEYFDISNSLNQSKYYHLDYEQDGGLLEGEKMVREICRIRYVPVLTIVALDEDKLQVSQNHCLKYGLPARKIRSTFGPEMHSVPSVVNSPHLAGHLEKSHQSVRKCMILLLRSLSNWVLDP